MAIFCQFQWIIYSKEQKKIKRKAFTGLTSAKCHKKPASPQKSLIFFL